MSVHKLGNVLMGRNGPLYWIGIYIFILIVIMPMICILAQATNEYECRSWVGKDYIYHNSHCYRVVDNQMIYVDVRLEKKLRELQLKSPEVTK